MTDAPYAASYRWYLQRGYQVAPLSAGGVAPIPEAPPTTTLTIAAAYDADYPGANIGIALPPSAVALRFRAAGGAAAGLAAAYQADPANSLGPTKAASWGGNEAMTIIYRVGQAPPNYATNHGINIMRAPGVLVAPPSVVQGKAWEWTNFDVTLAPMPDWLLHYLNNGAPEGAVPTHEHAQTILRDVLGATPIDDPDPGA